MIGNGYWATGIVVRYAYSGSGGYGWQARVEFRDDGFAGDAHAGRVSTEGRLNTRYFVVDSEGGGGLTAAVDAVKADAHRLGIAFERHRPFSAARLAATPRGSLRATRRIGGNWLTRSRRGSAGKGSTSAPDPPATQEPPVLPGRLRYVREGALSRLEASRYPEVAASDCSTGNVEASMHESSHFACDTATRRAP